MILDLFKLDNKVALVTGAGRGLGQAMAIALAEAGADVAGLDVLALDETAARVQALGRRFLPLSANLLAAHAADMTAVVQQVVSGLGSLDILINNAGIIRRVVSSGVLGEEVPYRVWYCGNVFRKADVHRGRFHEFRQIGAELLGLNSIERDVEILEVALECLAAAGMKDVQLHLNHAGIFRGIISSLALDPEALRQVKTEIDRKDMRRVAARLQDFGVAPDIQRQVNAICRCVGTKDDLCEARAAIDNTEAAAAIDELLELASRLSPRTDNIVFDLTEIDEMEYYTGVMFAFFSSRVSAEVGKGGRYDALLQEFGRSMPAVGFSFSMDNLVSLL